MDARMKWEALDKRRKEKLIDKHRDANVDHVWWDFTHEDFKERMKEIGVHVEKIYFSGFYSQGDGACFDGRVADWPKFLEAVGKPELLEHVVEHGLRLSWSSAGRYSHSHSVSFHDSELWIDNPHDEDDDPLRHAAWEALNPGMGGPVLAHLDDFKEFLRGKMDDLYNELESEYDDLTSDETIIDYLVENQEDEIDEVFDEQQEEALA